MKYFLDTNIIIYAVKGMFPNLKKHFAMVPSTSIVIPSVVCAELEYGARFSRDYHKTKAIYSAFVREFQVANFGKAEAEAYGRIRSQLEKSGKLIGPNDLIIASTAFDGGILVTHNVKEFSRVPGLALEDWTE